MTYSAQLLPHFYSQTSYTGIQGICVAILSQTFFYSFILLFHFNQFSSD